MHLLYLTKSKFSFFVDNSFDATCYQRVPSNSTIFIGFNLHYLFSVFYHRGCQFRIQRLYKPESSTTEKIHVVQNWSFSLRESRHIRIRHYFEYWKHRFRALFKIPSGSEECIISIQWSNFFIVLMHLITILFK